MSLSKPASQPSRIISPHWHVLTNAPDAPATHWKQYALPLQHPRTVDAGTPVDVEFTCIPDDPGFCQHAGVRSRRGRALGASRQARVDVLTRQSHER
jgi:hypothetical protein